MDEKIFEDIICRYPELIEHELQFKGRQVIVNRKRVDILFEDRHGQLLIVEMKKGTILRKHVGQLLDYEGDFVTEDNPNIRVMLVGNRVPENLRRSLDHHGFEWKELTITTLVNFVKTKDEPNFLSCLTSEEPLLLNMKKTSEQQLIREKSQAPLLESNKSSSSSDIDQAIKINSKSIIEKTETLFRQNNDQLNGANIYFTLSKNNWRINERGKNAIVYYSRSSNRLVVIPKNTVDKYIFDPFFQKISDGYDLSPNFEAFAISETDRRINLKFEIKNDQLMVSLKALVKNGGKLIPLISLPSAYWPEIHSENIDTGSKIIAEITRICRDFSNGGGIVSIKDY